MNDERDEVFPSREDIERALTDSGRDADTVAALPSELLTSARGGPQWYGWRPSPPDHRDHLFVPARRTIAALPSFTDNWRGSRKIPIYDQLALGSCTANATLRAWRIMLLRTVGGLHYFDPSRLAHYYWTRALDGSEGYDAGAYVRDALKILGKVGVVADKLWPYVISNYRAAPTGDVVLAAAKRIRVEYLSVRQSETHIKTVLATRNPVVFGMSIFESTEDAMDVGGSGQVPMPGDGEAVLGGHCMMIEDFDDVHWEEPVYIVANSWGTDTGLGARPGMWPVAAGEAYDAEAMKGYLAIPQRMLHDPDIADDFWTIKAAA